MSLPGDLSSVPNTLLGGNIVAVVARQLIRARAMRGAIAFELRKMGLNDYAFNALNPVAFVAGVPINVRTQEAYTYQADVTEHALENGAIISDHVILKPVRVEVSFGVSNWTPGEASTALHLLEEMYKTRALLDLQTTHSEIKNVALVNLQVVNTTPAWGALEFRATFQQLRFVALETVRQSEERAVDTSGLPPVTGGPAVPKSVGPTVNKGTTGASVYKKLFSGALE